MEGERHDARPAPAASESDPFDALVERHRAYERDLTAIAHEAEAVLRRREEHARAAADRIVLEARVEAARLLSDAREEVRALGEQAASLRQAQREAAEALQHTRRALDEALGVAGVIRTGVRHEDDVRQDDGVRGQHEAARTDSARAEAKTASHAAEPASHAAAEPAAPSHRRGLLLGTAATLAVLAAITALWIWGRERVPEAVSSSRDGGTGLAAAPRAAVRKAVPPPEVAGREDAARPEVAVPVAESGDISRPQRREITRGTPAAAPAPAHPLTVDIEARRPVWLRATVDGQQGPGGTLRAGRRRRITAADAVIIRTGDAGALMFSVNGGAPQPFGADGAIRTRRFEAPAEPSKPPASKAPPSGPTQRQPAAPPSRESAGLPVAATGGISAPPPASITASPGTAPLLQAPAAQVPPQTAPPRSSAVSRDPDDLTAQIVEADRRWFDAYYRGDRASVARLSAEGFDLTDGRPPDRRVPPGVRPERVLVDPQVDVHGDGAVLSGRMIERTISNGTTREYESFVSQVWVRREGTWRLLGLRLATGDALREAAGSLR